MRNALRRASMFDTLLATVAKCALDVDIHRTVAAINPMLVIAAAVGVNFVGNAGVLHGAAGLSGAWGKAASGKTK